MSTEKTPSEISSKTLARKPRGLADRGASDIAATDAMMKTIREVYSRYGFDALETPFLEYTDALGKFLPDQDRPNAGVFSLRDDDEQWMSLRYDLTAPLARYCAENWQNLPKPYRSYRSGWVFRNEKPGPGRFRQFMQFDADTVGAASVAADAEMCMMAADTLEALGLHEPADENGYEKPLYVIKVNNRKVLDGVMEAIGIGGAEHAATRLTVLRAIDKADKFEWEEIEKLLGEGRWDGGHPGKGDFTKGAGLSGEQIDRVSELIHLEYDIDEFMHDNGDYRRFDEEGNEIENNASIENPKFLRELEEQMFSALALISASSSVALEGVAEMRQINELIRAAGYGPDRIRIDPSIVRGLEYYTGSVFEAELLFGAPGEDGKHVRIGAVGGGGRYDGLVSRFLDEPVPATGFSIGVSRLLAALQALGKVSTTAEPGPVIVLAMDRTPEAMASYQQIVADLRSNGIRAEIYLGPAGMKAQLKYADRRQSRVVIIQGSNEREQGEVQVKDLLLGENLSAIADREEYQRQKALTQRSVPVANVVDAVREVLARQG